MDSMLLKLRKMSRKKRCRLKRQVLALFMRADIKVLKARGGSSHNSRDKKSSTRGSNLLISLYILSDVWVESILSVLVT